ncbi:MAG: hypothetical protein GY906_22745 [bacterium]|nr:hypothetical protein [bacterium]
MSTAIVKQDAAEVVSVERDRFLPVMSIAQAGERRAAIIEVVKSMMKEDVDFGKIPGTQKKSLWQPGSDKLCNLFGLTPAFDIESMIEDWDGSNHSGEPFFYYRVKCFLQRGDHVMGEGEGSCNSWEEKYRWRQGERKCPTCGKGAIIKGKAEYGGGWICFGKKGGCGAKYQDGDQVIEGQNIGRQANPQIHDQVNTILKMAHKRAKIAATINATSASEFFTQDLEDLPTGTVAPDTPRAPQKPATVTKAALGPDTSTVEDEELQILWSRIKGKKTCVEVFGELKAELTQRCGRHGDPQYYQVLKAHNVEHANEFSGLQEARQAVKDLLSIVRTAREMDQAPTDEQPSLLTNQDPAEKGDTYGAD